MVVLSWWVIFVMFQTLSLVVVERERPIGAAYESTNPLQDNRHAGTVNQTEVSVDVMGASSGELG